MNITYNKKKYIYIVIWLLIGILSFTVLEKYASAPGSHQTTIASVYKGIHIKTTKNGLPTY